MISEPFPAAEMSWDVACPCLGLFEILQVVLSGQPFDLGSLLERQGRRGVFALRSSGADEGRAIVVLNDFVWAETDSKWTYQERMGDLYLGDKKCLRCWKSPWRQMRSYSCRTVVTRTLLANSRLPCRFRDSINTN